MIDSFRRCIFCNRNTIFRYDKIIGHSKCVKCGSGYALPLSEKKIIIDRIKSSLNKKVLYYENMRKQDKGDVLRGRLREIKSIIQDLNKLVKD